VFFRFIEAERPQRRRYKERAGSKVNSGSFLNRAVCKRALSVLLGVGNSTIERIRNNIQSMPKVEPKHPALGFSLRVKAWHRWPKVLLFFWTLYHSVAEGLPDHWVQLDSRVKEDELERVVSRMTLDVSTYGRSPESLLRGPGFSGPVRYLPHGHAIHLYYDYVALSRKRNEDPASLSTFMRVHRKVFGRFLKFRKKAGQHAVCNICVGLRRDVTQAKSIVDRERVLEAYLHHVLSQYMDRQVWWALGETSMAWCAASQRLGSRMAQISVMSSTCALIVDGMDQSKFRLPRITTTGRVPKAVEKLMRPCLHVVGAWLKGGPLHFAITDENIKKDSACYLEVVSRCIEAHCF
jgi:hypothetical protein